MALAQDLLLSSMHCVMVLYILRRLCFIFLDGHKAEARICARNVCDIFTSLSDNKHETFGLKLVEAMAAGKAVIVTDWDGYLKIDKCSERGCMVPAFMPETFGDDLVQAHEAGSITYDQYLAHASSFVSVDLRALREALSPLILAPICGAR